MAKKKNELKETVEVKDTPVVETEMKEEVKDPKLEGKKPEEMSAKELKEYHATLLDEYKERIDKIMDEEGLKAEEQKIIDLYQKHDDVIKNRQYELPESVAFNGTSRYSQKDVARLICKFINRMEVDYRTTLGMWQLYKFWLNPSKTIGYGAYDSTLRILGQTKFKGFTEWQDIMVIVEYFKQCNEAYAKDAEQYDFLADWHNMVMSRMELVSGHNTEADALEGVQTPIQ